MQQPPGFVDSRFSNHVCKLHKSIYGLRQAPPVWYTEIKEFLLSCDFALSKSDDSLFIKWSPNSLIIIMIYVDDIIVTGFNNSHVQTIIKQLGDRFSIKDLGPLHFFLGVEVIQHAHGLTLTQSSFIANILSKFNMLDANSVSTPLSTSDVLSLDDDGSPTADAALYRQVIGSLQYLTFTRPDICFVVNKIA